MSPKGPTDTCQWEDHYHFEGMQCVPSAYPSQFEGRRQGGFVLTYSHPGKHREISPFHRVSQARDQNSVSSSQEEVSAA